MTDAGEKTRIMDKDVIGSNPDLQAENELLMTKIIDLQKKIECLEKELARERIEKEEMREMLNREIESLLIVAGEQERKKREEKRLSKAEKSVHKNKRGAPVGHRGNTRPKPGHVDETCLYPLDKCPNCNADSKNIIIYNESIVYEEQIVPAKTRVKKKVKQHGYCTTCHQKVSAFVPDGMYHFHPETQAIIAAKQIEERLTFHLIDASFSTFSDFKITPQGANNVVARVARILLPVYNHLGNMLKETAYLYADETTWPVNGHKSWSWYFGNEIISYYQFATSRGQKIPQGILGNTYDGILIIDGYKGYKIDCVIQRCWIHLDRKIEKLLEMPYISDNGRNFLESTRKNVSREILHIHKQFREGVINKIEYCEVGKKLRDKFYSLLSQKEELANIRDKKIINWIKEREKERGQLFTFIDHPEIKVHTNDAERALRPEVVYRKISGGHRTENGAQNYAIIFSIWQTCKKNGINFFDYYQKVHRWYFDDRKEPPPRILENTFNIP